MELWSHEERYNQKRTRERISKVAPVTKNITEKMVKWYGHVKRRDEGHALRTMLDIHQNQERDAEEDRNPVGNTGENRYGKCKGYSRRRYWTRESGRMICKTIPVTPDDGIFSLTYDLLVCLSSVCPRFLCLLNVS